MKTRISSIVCVICLLLCFSFALSSCKSNNAVGIEGAHINKNGELVLTYSDGTEQSLGVVVGKDGADGQDGTNGAVVSLDITANGSSIPVASSKGVRSAVSIACNIASQ